MKIVKLHKPQRMGSLENVLAYSGEDDKPDSTFTDSTDVVTDSTRIVTTDRGVSLTTSGDEGRITFTLDLPFGEKEGTGDDPDSTIVSISGGLFGVSAGIEIAIPQTERTAVPQPSPFPMPGEVEYDEFGRKLIH